MDQSSLCSLARTLAHSLTRFSAEVYGVVGAGVGRAIVRSLTLSLAQSGGTWSGGWSMRRSIVYSLASQRRKVFFLATFASRTCLAFIFSFVGDITDPYFVAMPHKVAQNLGFNHF